MYFINRDQYSSKKEFDQAVKDARGSAAKVVKVTGGYAVFDSRHEYDTWRKQK